MDKQLAGQRGGQEQQQGGYQWGQGLGQGFGNGFESRQVHINTQVIYFSWTAVATGLACHLHYMVRQTSVVHDDGCAVHVLMRHVSPE